MKKPLLCILADQQQRRKDQMNHLNTLSRDGNEETEIRALRLLQELARFGATSITLPVSPENWALKQPWISFGGFATFDGGTITLHRKVKVQAAA